MKKHLLLFRPLLSVRLPLASFSFNFSLAINDHRSVPFAIPRSALLLSVSSESLGSATKCFADLAWERKSARWVEKSAPEKGMT
jgi:hypothetical protein